MAFMTFIYEWIISEIYDIIAGIIGLTSIILPQEVSEHFLSSRERIVSFIFIMLIVNGAAKIILSALMAVIDLFSSNGHFSRDVLDSFHFNNPFLRGYKDGYDDGRHYRDSKLRLLKHTSIWVRFWNVGKYVLIFLLFYSVIMTSDW